MIRDFFIKKENIFIGAVAVICIFFVILGFLFLFFRTSSESGPRIIPNTVDEILWATFKSDLVAQKIEYPKYMYVNEQKEQEGVGITFVEFDTDEFLTYFSNQNHVSIYPQGSDAPFFYAKTKEDTYTSKAGQEFDRTEFLTEGNAVWAVKLVPKITPEKWQPWGFILIQSKIRDKEQGCHTEDNKFELVTDCDPYQGQKVVYIGEVSESFFRLGYAIIDKNTFK